MDIKKILTDIAIAVPSAAVNGGDQRLDVVIVLLHQMLGELRRANDLAALATALPTLPPSVFEDKPAKPAKTRAAK